VGYLSGHDQSKRLTFNYRCDAIDPAVTPYLGYLPGLRFELARSGML
jgi:hypothetical protein